MIAMGMSGVCVVWGRVGDLGGVDVVVWVAGVGVVQWGLCLRVGGICGVG